MISILMPIYNGIEFIGESVPTILYQTYKEWELIIGINGHPKDSDVYKEAKKWEEKDERIKVYDFYEIKGKAEALNEMIKYCKYDWVSLLDVDDKWLPKKLEAQERFMYYSDVIGTQCKYFGDLNTIPKIPVGDLTSFNFLIFNPIINSSCLLKKELCNWDGSLNLEDYDLWLKLWKEGKQFYNVNEILVLHRIHNDSAFNAKGNNLKVNDLKKKYIHL
jgi:glycosyltransferase involved in cell wall biosynthesis